MLCTFYTLGAPTIALGDAVTLGATTAIFLAILSPWLLGEASTGRVWVPTLIAFGGVALVVGPQFEIAGQTGLVAVAGSFFSALAMVMLRKLGGAKGGLRESPEAIVVHFSLVATVALCALAAPAWRTPGASGAALLAVTGITGGLAQLAMTRAYALDHAARIGTIAYVAVVPSQRRGASIHLEEYSRPPCPLRSARSQSTPGAATRPG
jgi:drug/metabolite transporter (DMT)-like permease